MTDLKKEIIDAFEFCDKNKDGFITSDELFDMLSTFSVDISKKESDELFKAFDEDHNGKIDFKEFEALYRELKKYE